MPVPPRGDPRRPLHLAVSSCRLLGVLGLLAGTCVGIPLFSGRRSMSMAFDALVVFVCTGGVGVALLVLAHHIKRRRFWAVTTALILTSTATLGFAALTLGTGFVMLSAQRGLQQEWTFWSALGFYGLITVAPAQLVYHLARSFPALNIVPPDEVRGFDVLPLAVLPSEPPAAGGEP